MKFIRSFGFIILYEILQILHLRFLLNIKRWTSVTDSEMVGIILFVLFLPALSTVVSLNREKHFTKIFLNKVFPIIQWIYLAFIFFIGICFPINDTVAALGEIVYGFDFQIILGIDSFAFFLAFFLTFHHLSKNNLKNILFRFAPPIFFTVFLVTLSIWLEYPIIPEDKTEVNIQSQSKSLDMEKSLNTLWKSYTSKYHYKFSYPSDSLLETKDGTHLKIVLPLQPKSNLSDIHVDVSIYDSRDESAVREGLEVPSSTSKNLTFGGNSFSLTEGGDAGAGQYYDERLYSTGHDNLVLSFHFVIHSVNRGTSDPQVQQFDQNKVDQMIDNMLSTLVWLAE